MWIVEGAHCGFLQLPIALVLSRNILHRGDAAAQELRRHSAVSVSDWIDTAV
jgi:hypothetical protein